MAMGGEAGRPPARDLVPQSSGAAPQGSARSAPHASTKPTPVPPPTAQEPRSDGKRPLLDAPGSASGSEAKHGGGCLSGRDRDGGGNGGEGVHPLDGGGGSGGGGDTRPGRCDEGGGRDGDGDFRPGSRGRGGSAGGGGGACSGGHNKGGDACLGGCNEGRGGHGSTCSGTRDGGGGTDGRVATRVGIGGGHNGLDGGGGACAGTVGEADAFRGCVGYPDGSVRDGSVGGGRSGLYPCLS
uniref:Uncharacterized protein n=1 Tax=Setaria viridis TaxID=4556 RepID=A0A4U6UU70_SETVI|nr:hypothetical protein SEVIR_4G062500v2 [Setaria viridis]